MSQTLESLKKFAKMGNRHLDAAASTGQILRALILIAFGIIAFASILRPHESQASESFHGFIQGLWPQAKARGVSRATFDRAFIDVTPDDSVLAKTKTQAEFVRPLPVYLASAVSANRIETGQARARDWKPTLERAEHEFGVDPYIILGVWGLETNFGKNPGDLSTIRCLATLAYAHYRGDYFRKELLDALDILQQGHINAQAMQGSWAGAMGQTQFMPSAFKRYAIDFEGSGRKDIWHSVPTALGSTAYFLKKHGWIAGETWGYEVIQPNGARAADARSHSFAAWAAEGYRRADGAPMPDRGQASLIAPAGPDGPHFLVTRNFKVIKSYNNSTAYALGVSLLAERIAGSPPLRAAWPVASR
jgi:membrane-bound lytic murein transglycosylase B